MRAYTLITGVAGVLLFAGSARAAETATEARAVEFREAPYGPGTEDGSARVGDEYRVHEGAEAGAQVGGGFSSPYGLGLGARLGYTFHPGVYVGAAYTHYFGPTDSSHADFFGAEAGYKFFPTARWELRPYGFLGPAFITRADGETRSSVAFQPSLLTAYHFGDWFISAEARGLVAPDPAAFALLGGIGVGL